MGPVKFCGAKINSFFIFAKNNFKNFKMINDSKIKNLIFDLGNVIVELDVNRSVKCFGSEIYAVFSDKMKTEFVELAHKFERGEVSSDYFRKMVSQMYEIEISDEKFDECWCAMIKTIPDNRKKMLRELKKKYKVIALSNINEIHYDFLLKSNFWEAYLFEKVYFSHLLGMRKPEIEIYEYVLTENDMKPEETLFFDDLKENVEAAKKLGINSILVDTEILKIVEEMFV